MRDAEKTLRHTLLWGALGAWVIAVGVTIGVYTEVLDVLRGWGLIANLALALAVTLTVVWAQFRVRRVMADVFDAGLRVQREAEAMRAETEAIREEIGR